MPVQPNDNDPCCKSVFVSKSEKGQNTMSEIICIYTNKKQQKSKTEIRLQKYNIHTNL